MGDDCRLSVVVTSRNDGHGGDMLARFRLFADGLLAQARRHGLTGELIVVEWNPPPGPRLREVVKLRETCEHFPIRFIEVPPEIHDALPTSREIPLFQMIAKNVGIRRAHGRFVLATNPDLLFTDALVRTLVADLDPGVLYRVDRTDVAADIPYAADLPAQIAWCEHHVLRVHTRWGTVPAGSLRDLVSPHNLVRIAAGLRRRVAASLQGVRRRGHSSVRFLRSSIAGVLRVSGTQAIRLAKGIDSRPNVHTNGCGDFTLLSREMWEELRGYPELPIWSMHIDSLLCYMAVAAGCRERVLSRPARMFHVEHGSSWVALDLGARLRTFASKPWLDERLLQDLWTQMYRSGRALCYNDPDWGFGRHSFPETVLGTPESCREAMDGGGAG